jgi:hypothetical protein
MQLRGGGKGGDGVVGEFDVDSEGAREKEQLGREMVGMGVGFSPGDAKVENDVIEAGGGFEAGEFVLELLEEDDCVGYLGAEVVEVGVTDEEIEAGVAWRAIDSVEVPGGVGGEGVSVEVGPEARRTAGIWSIST